MESISPTLQAICARLDLTQEQLAERLGVSFATVNRWEGGVTMPQRAARTAIEACCRGGHRHYRASRGRGGVIGPRDTAALPRAPDARSDRQATIEAELADVKRRLVRLYDLAEITNLDIDDFKPRIRDYRERQERLEATAEEGCRSAGRSWTTWRPSRPTPWT